MAAVDEGTRGEGTAETCSVYTIVRERIFASANAEVEAEVFSDTITRQPAAVRI